MRIPFLFLLLFFTALSNNISGQRLKGVSRPEKWWAVTHPFIANKAYRCTRYVIKVCDSLKKENRIGSDLNGGKLDAFKHTFWMAYLGSNISPKKAYKLGVAHEKGNYLMYKKGKQEDGILPDSVSGVMDIINNQSGIEIAVNFRIWKKENQVQEMIEYVLIQLEKGNLYCLLKNKKGEFISCNGEIIQSATYNKKWGVPKCLVKSNVQTPE